MPCFRRQLTLLPLRRRLRADVAASEGVTCMSYDTAAHGAYSADADKRYAAAIERRAMLRYYFALPLR